ncbi:MAG: hypothetical protein QN160_10685 [Armatimonadota bacterium]|nr:hypothetical protein [Armatimonadota bacterium]
MATARVLGRRSESLVVEYLAHGHEIELLRRAGTVPRRLLHSTFAHRLPSVHLYGPALTSPAEALAFIHLVRALSDVLHPLAGVFDEHAGDEWSHANDKGDANVRDHAKAKDYGNFRDRRNNPGAPRLPVDRNSAAHPDPGERRVHGLPAWLTLVGGDRVTAIGASRLLMAPVYLIDPLDDGGLLIAATPLPREACANAGRRSGARAPLLPEQGWWPGAPLLGAEELLPAR